jgi:hypothetical protein
MPPHVAARSLASFNVHVHVLVLVRLVHVLVLGPDERERVRGVRVDAASRRVGQGAAERRKVRRYSH